MSFQLGRPAVGEFTVLRFCHYGYPLAILNKPFPEGWDGPVFTTCWWLTCPLLQKDIQRLEGASYLKKMAGLLPEKQEEYYRKKAREKRLQLLSPWEIRFLQEQKPHILRDFLCRGIAGEENPGLKCLHAHYAFYLMFPEYKLGREIDKILPGRLERRCGGRCRLG